MVESPSTSFNGRVSSISMDAYTPLIELKENKPPIGYTLLKNSNIMDNAYIAMRDYVRAPIIKTTNSKKLENDFTSNLDDTWLTYIKDLIANADYELELDEEGQILFGKKKEIATIQPRWTFDDNNSSILLPEIRIDHDLYGIPNVVQVVYSDGRHYYEHRAVNKDPDSPTSTVSRGREIIYRDTNPNLAGVPTSAMVKEYAEKLLEELSSIEYSITYSHGYCPVRLGDVVRLNYKKAGITDIKARVVSQKIDCTSGCKVTETAVFSSNLWR